MNVTIEKEDVERRMSALSTILETMDIPAVRKDLTQISNIRWLVRNIRANNNDHPLIGTAVELASFILRKHFLLRRF